MAAIRCRAGRRPHAARPNPASEATPGGR
jgi:hypothetical protein